MLWKTALSVLAGIAITGGTALAQTSTSGATESGTDADLLTTEDLRQLVAPVALYPDTLLIQILVASTFPLQVIKADQMVTDNAAMPPEDLQAKIGEQGWDESVTVLATAFPDVLADMADHANWTDTMGTAMLAQDEDVMAAIQDMRAVAAENGALASTPEQTVEVTQQGGDQTIVIEPADPQVVYVPQYDSNVVYDDNRVNTGDILTTGLITFGTIALIDEIFDNDDPWNDYWGCRNCGGWNGGPIVRNPNIDIDVDGNVNIGNNIGAGWKPEDVRRDKARDDIRKRKGPDGATTLPVKKPDRGDDMRKRLSSQTGAPDISRPGAAATLPARPGGLSQADRSAAIDRTRDNVPGAKKPAANRPSAKPAQAAPAKAKAKAKTHAPTAAKPAARKPSGGGQAMQKRAAPKKTNAGSARGRSAASGKRR